MLRFGGEESREQYDMIVLDLPSFLAEAESKVPKYPVLKRDRKPMLRPLNEIMCTEKKNSEKL